MQFMKMIFTWWHGQTLGAALNTWRRGELVGRDEQGNKYYQDKNGASVNGKTRRWVAYNGDVEATRIPPEWHGWLHYTVDDIPNQMAFGPDQVVIERRTWHKSHQINLTGTENARKPAGSVDAASFPSGYQSWKPE